jgi:diamine N-acetyltransferase
MIRLEKVTEKTFKAVVRLKTTSEQEQFVSSNLISLAQAWLYYDAAVPLAILDDDTVVGFLMLDWDEDERTVGIWRFMIAAEHQGKGYGRAAMIEALRMIRETRKFDLVHLDIVPGNTVAHDLYYSLGFRENGKMEEDEIIMTLPLTDEPQVGALIADEDDIEDFKDLIEREKTHGAKIPQAVETEEMLRKTVDAGQVVRMTLFGETIGLYASGELLLADEHKSYRAEAEEKVKKFRK